MGMKLTVLVALLATSFLQAPSFAAPTVNKIVGQVGMIDGEVLIDGQEVKKNTPVREGAVVETKKGKATLLLGTGAVFHLAANTKMVVKQFGMRPDSHKEGGDVDLRFGRTRALILNKGNETKDVRIQTRTATMGVRGTEIFIDAPYVPPGTPANMAPPVQFFTMEGSAAVAITPQAPPIVVAQNKGMSAGASADGQMKASAPTMSIAQVQETIDSSGMKADKFNTTGDMRKAARQYDPHEGPLTAPAVRFDPLIDSKMPLNIVPQFCNATGGNNC